MKRRYNKIFFKQFSVLLKYIVTKKVVFLLGALFIICSFFTLNTSMAAEKEKQTPIDLDITTHLGNGQVFIQGDIVHYYISLSQNAYLLLLYQDANNNIYQMLPSKYSPTAYFSAKDYFLFPGAGIPYEFEVSPPYGSEKIWLFAANKPFPQLTGETLDNGFRLVKTKNMYAVRKIVSQFSLRENVKVTTTYTEIITIQK